MADSPQLPPQQAGPHPRALATIFLTISLDLLGFGMILPLLPFYAQDFGASPFAVGVLFASFSLSQLVFSPILGRLSDQRGRRPVLLITLAGSVAANLLFATAGSFLVLLLARTASGVAAANYGIAQAYIADVTSPENRSRGMGLVGVAFGLGFVLGPALGGLLGLWGHVAVALGAAALAALNLVLAAVWLPESLPAENRARARSWLGLEAVTQLRRAPLALGLMVLFFSVTFCFALMEATLALFCQARLDFGHLETTWLFVFIGVVLVLVQGGLVGPLVRRFGERRLIPTGIAMMASGLLLLAGTPPRPLFIVTATALLAVGAGLHNPPSFGLLSRLTPADSQGGILGVSRSFGALARVVGPVAGTWIFGRWGTAWPFWSGGALMALTLVMAVSLLRRLS